MKRLAILVIMAALVTSCGGPTTYGTIVGYENVTDNQHVTDIEMNDVPPGTFPIRTAGIAHEDERVVILEQRPDEGWARIRNAAGAEGWVQSDSLKDISEVAVLVPTTMVAQTHHVVYQVTGTAATAIVTYTGPDDKHAAFLIVQLPWSLKFDALPNQYLFISARNPHTPTAVVCTVLVDGKVWKTDNHTGDNSMAVCGDE